MGEMTASGDVRENRADSVCVCVDAAGGEAPVAEILEGVAAALEADSGLSVIVAGPSSDVEPFARRFPARCVALPCTQVIAMDEHPVEAVRTKRDSSIVAGCKAVRDGLAQGFFSAGSTGAVMAAATMGIGRIKGIERPAITTVLPGARPTVLLDMGANADCRAEYIVQFAEMGCAYARVVLGVDHPRVGLLNIGSEDTKGSEMALAYHAALAEGDCGFAGNAEGTDLLAGTFDVIVADGFTGNVALKSVEGAGKFVLSRLKAAMGESLKNKIGMALLAGSLKSMAAELSGDEYGGAILLGLRAPVLKGHGATSARAVERGTLFAASVVRAGLVERVADLCDVSA